MARTRGRTVRWSGLLTNHRRVENCDAYSLSGYSLPGHQTIEGVEMRIVLSVFLASAIAAMSGCSFSQSSGSISDSISNSSESVSNSVESSSDSAKSSSDGDDEAAKPEAPQDTASYEEDVSQLAVTYAKSGGDIGAFRGAVTQLAMARGITNWEVDSRTSQAIGRGVGTAGMQEEPFTDFSEQLFGDDLGKLNDLRTGYQQTAQPQTQPAPEAQPEPAGQSEPAAS